MNHQVRVFEIDRDAQSFALNRRTQSRVHIKIHCVTELIAPGRLASFDARRKMIGIVAAQRGFAKGTDQIAKRLESQKVQALVGEFELDAALDWLAGL